MLKKILGLAATAALALGATSAQAVTLNIGTVTGSGQGLDIPNLTVLANSSIDDYYIFQVNSGFDLRLESSVSFVSYLNVNPFAASISSCTDSTCASTSLVSNYSADANNSRSYIQSPIANGYYVINVTGSVNNTDGNRYSGQANFFNVPEPATIGLFSLGLAAVGIVRRRRKA